MIQNNVNLSQFSLSNAEEKQHKDIQWLLIQINVKSLKHYEDKWHLVGKRRGRRKKEKEEKENSEVPFKGRKPDFSQFSEGFALH